MLKNSKFNGLNIFAGSIGSFLVLSIFCSLLLCPSLALANIPYTVVYYDLWGGGPYSSVAEACEEVDLAGHGYGTYYLTNITVDECFYQDSVSQNIGYSKPTLVQSCPSDYDDTGSDCRKHCPPGQLPDEISQVCMQPP